MIPFIKSFKNLVKKLSAVDLFFGLSISAKSLKVYQDKLNDSFILQDLHQYRNFSKFLNSHHDFMEVYPNFINEALGKFFTGFGHPKKLLYKDIIRSLTSRKPLLSAVGDIVSFGRSIIGR